MDHWGKYITTDTSDSSLYFNLKKFWELRKNLNYNTWPLREQKWEQHFVNHVTRDKSGHYIVAFPFIKKKIQLGETYSRILNPFFSLEKSVILI